MNNVGIIHQSREKLLWYSILFEATLTFQVERSRRLISNLDKINSKVVVEQDQVSLVYRGVYLVQS